MIRAKFYQSGGKLKGFDISGHAGYAELGQDVVCASVSSAVQFAVNILDEFDCKPEVSVEDNLISCRITASVNTAGVVLEVFRNHLESILEEFPKTIKITISEV
ncbi:MAG: ribosomal-processing cysteine protease Prp [Ruminococcus flavefaciens]|nr:ribosomal-processing cysteine protease Prp [Ruminococcus flavefaciens]